jgi:predicted flap endonuclease-1-like 5' DNA nuclease
MLYLISVFWFWLLLALILGLAVGWFTFARSGKGNWGGIIPWALVFGTGAVVAGFRLLPKTIGYWFDLAVLMLAAYLVGCLLSALFRSKGSAAEPAAMTEAARTEPVFATPARELAVEPAKSGMALPTEAIEQAIVGLSAPRAGRADDLKKIYGVEPETEGKLNALGLYHYDQIASLTPGNRRWLFRQLGYDGRFPSWWWRWRYDAEQLATGRAGSTSTQSPAVAAMVPAPEAPSLAAAVPAQAAGEGSKPAGIAEPREGKADDLKRIRGIGKQNEGRLHGLGIWHFDQIAAWSPGEIIWVGAFLAFPGRIEREDWVGQAALLARGEATEFSKRADAGKVATSRDDTGDDGQGNVVAPDPVNAKKPAKLPKGK